MAAAGRKVPANLSRHSAMNDSNVSMNSCATAITALEGPQQLLEAWRQRLHEWGLLLRQSSGRVLKRELRALLVIYMLYWGRFTANRMLFPSRTAKGSVLSRLLPVKTLARGWIVYKVLQALRLPQTSHALDALAQAGTSIAHSFVGAQPRAAPAFRAGSSFSVKLLAGALNVLYAFRFSFRSVRNFELRLHLFANPDADALNAHDMTTPAPLGLSAVRHDCSTVDAAGSPFLGSTVLSVSRLPRSVGANSAMSAGVASRGPATARATPRRPTARSTEEAGAGEGNAAPAARVAHGRPPPSPRPMPVIQTRRQRALAAKHAAARGSPAGDANTSDAAGSVASKASRSLFVAAAEPTATATAAVDTGAPHADSDGAVDGFEGAEEGSSAAHGQAHEADDASVKEPSPDEPPLFRHRHAVLSAVAGFDRSKLRKAGSGPAATAASNAGAAQSSARESPPRKPMSTSVFAELAESLQRRRRRISTSVCAMPAEAGDDDSVGADTPEKGGSAEAGRPDTQSMLSCMLASPMMQQKMKAAAARASTSPAKDSPASPPLRLIGEEEAGPRASSRRSRRRRRRQSSLFSMDGALPAAAMQQLTSMR